MNFVYMSIRFSKFHVNYAVLIFGAPSWDVGFRYVYAYVIIAYRKWAKETLDLTSWRITLIILLMISTSVDPPPPLGDVCKQLDASTCPCS